MRGGSESPAPLVRKIGLADILQTLSYPGFSVARFKRCRVPTSLWITR
jgi:hypothetical protein